MNRLLTGALLLSMTAALSGCPWGSDDDDDPTPVATYTIGGSISGLTASGLVLQVNGASSTSIASGATTFTSSVSLASGATYQVSISTQPATQTCAVTNGSGTVASANITNVAINCVTNTFTVGATVNGLTGSGLVLQLNSANNLSVAANATGLQTFATPINAGATYAVSVLTQPTSPLQQCTVTNGNGTITANVTNVVVTCVNVATISGVAAVGTPLVGTVSVKDAGGVIRTVSIGSNGSYSIDVNGMTPPFVLLAEGRANGRTYTVHSAAVQADIGGTINITQLTDLVVDNIAGQIASTYFDAGNFSALTPSALNAEVALLKARLLPVLQALGVDASIDLLRSQFTPLASALDSALDILRVSVNVANNVATITNIVTQQTIQDAINVPAASEGAPAVMDNVNNIANGVTDAAAVKAALTRVAARFASGLPSQAAIATELTSNHLFHDMDRATASAWLASNSDFIGSSFTNVDVFNINYSDPNAITANTDFSINGPNGSEIYRLRNYQVRKESDGVWRLHGDQRVLTFNVLVHPFKSQTSGCVSTGVEMHIEDLSSANNGAFIDHVMVFGPGLPNNTLRFNRPASGGGYWINTATNSAGFTMAYSCAIGSQLISDTVIGAIPDNATYIMVAYTSADNSVRYNFPSGALNLPGQPAHGTYWATTPRRPPTLAEAVASTLFPVITSPTSSALANYVSGPLTIGASNVTPNGYIDIILELDSSNGNSRDTDTLAIANAGGTVSTMLSLTPPQAGDVISHRSVRVAIKDPYQRTFMTGLDLP